MIFDIRAMRQHEAQLRAAGLAAVTSRRPGMGFWWGGPLGAARLLTATKPPGADPPPSGRSPNLQF
jgi:uncharacterized protein YbjT (DUF2867 family)